MSDVKGDNQNTDFDPDAWLDEQPEEARAAIDKYKDHHVTAVQRALDAERKNAKDLSRQIKDLSSKATGNTDLEKQIQELSSKADASTQRADFYEEAAKRGINPTRFGAAFRVAQVDNLINDKGRVDWDGLKESYQEFFVSTEDKDKSKGRGNVGGSNGRDTSAAKKTSMNDLIRNRS